MTDVTPSLIRLHGHAIAYDVGGAPLGSGRPVILLVHGLAGSAETWRDVIAALGDDVTVVAPDLLGHGRSDKPRQDYSLGGHASLLRDLMVALDIERATIVGHSLGGGVAMQLAYQHPERCERLVLESSGGLGSEVSWMLRAMALPGIEYLMPVLFSPVARDVGDAFGRQLRRIGIRPRVFEQEWRSFVSLTDAENRPAFLRTLRSVIDVKGQAVSAHDRLYLAARRPILIVWGRRDLIIPVDHAVAAAEAIPSCRLVIFERSGHFPHADEPVRFAQTLAEFVGTTTGLHGDDQHWRAALGAGASG